MSDCPARDDDRPRFVARRTRTGFSWTAVVTVTDTCNPVPGARYFLDVLGEDDEPTHAQGA